MINRKRVVVLTLIMMASALSACCVPAPWTSWRYYEKGGVEKFPSAWNTNTIDQYQNQYSDLYIDDAFVHIFVRAHNLSTRSGSSPFRLFVGVVTNKAEHKSVIYHAVSIVDTSGNTFDFQPIKYNTPRHAGEELGSLSFPVVVNLGFLHTYSSPQTNNYIQTSLWSDDTVPLRPENGRKITVFADIEIVGSHSSIRRTVVYEFLPTVRRGRWWCVTA